MWRWKDLGRKSPWHVAGRTLFFFVKYFDGNVYMDQGEGKRIYVVKGKE
jgi:hypothetical protein